MKVLKIVAISLVALVLVVGLIFLALGLILPDEVLVKNAIEIDATPDKIWQVMDEREKDNEWVPNIEKVEIIDDKKWKEFPKGSDRAIIFEVVKIQRPEKYEVKYEMEGFMSGQWRGTLFETEKGTLLRTEDKIIHKSWFGKIMMPLFFDLDSFAKEFNKKFKERVESLN